jgi:hypothetical protein
MSPRVVVTKILAVLGIVGLGLLAYAFVVRPWLSRWGATDAEVQMMLPADALLATVDFDATRAVTINARPEEIYPWLLQWGFGKAGFYGYDLIEGLGSPRGIRSADRIIPAFQNLSVGDKVKMNDIAYLSVRSLEPNRAIILTGGDELPISAMTWLIYPIDEGHSRLVNRFRFIQLWNSPLVVLTGLTEFGDTVALRKIMLGIKDRAEGRVEPLTYQVVEIASWLLSIIAFFAAVVMVFVRQSWRRAWLIALLAAGAFLIVFFAYPPLWLSSLLVVCISEGLVWAYKTTPSVAGARRRPTARVGPMAGAMRGRRV